MKLLFKILVMTTNATARIGLLSRFLQRQELLRQHRSCCMIYHRFFSSGIWRYPCNYKYTCSDVRSYTHYRPDILASPLVQVFGISLNTDFDDERQCEIYGSIRAIDGQGTISDLYDRSVDNTEIVLKHGYLSLIGNRTSYLICSDVNNTSLDLYLKDRTRNSVVFKGKLDLHSKTEEIEDSCDKLRLAVLQGEHGFVSVYFAKFLFGMTATVSVFFSRKYDKSCPFIDVYGSIVGGYGTSARHNCSSSDDELMHMRTTLFNKPSDQYVRAMCANPLKLSRCVVAVPAYSSLVIEANVSSLEGLVARGSVEFRAESLFTEKRFIDGENGTILIHVTWGSAYSRLCKPVVVGKGTQLGDIVQNERLDAEVKDRIVGKSKQMDTLNTALVQHDRQLKPEFQSFGKHFFSSLAPGCEEVVGTGLTEVFSVYVGGIGEKNFALCGSIVASDHFFNQIIYERGLSDPDLSVGGKVLPSVGSLIEHCNFYVDINLKDPVNDLEICKGSITWHEGQMYDPYDTETLFDTRLCSVVRGEHGYAAVHYMILYDACRATIDITFFFNEPSTTVPAANVYGSVIASYNGHDYSTRYARTFYQSRLFDRPQAEFVQLTSSSKIPLSKSGVAVPTDDYLLIQVDLRAFGNFDDVIVGKEELRIDLSKLVCKEIRGRYYGVQISAKFDDLMNI